MTAENKALAYELCYNTGPTLISPRSWAQSRAMSFAR